MTSSGCLVRCDMTAPRRWDPCVAHRGLDVEAFIAEYFASADRVVLFIAGAGFDPRSTAVATRLARAGATFRAVFFKENRPKPAQELVDRAAANTCALTSAFAQHSVVPVDIFGPDNAVIGGRNIVALLNGQDFNGVTDLGPVVNSR